MRYFIALGLVLSAPLAAAERHGLPSDPLSEGWIQLFDGKSLYGWKQANKADWTVRDGAIVATKGDVGLLHTTTQFADYMLRLEFRSAQDTNSGIFLRTSPRPQDPSKDCYELNIAPEDKPFPTGSFVGRKRVTGLGLSNQWRSYEITARGANFSVKLDGQKVLEFTDPEPLGRGFIGLQFNSGRVEFRNIVLRPLGLASLFNGQDLSGWKTDQVQKSVFSVKEKGVLNVKNGKGQLESEATFADLVLQLEIFCNGKELNSGIFFRSIPGQFWNGYESQIHNGFHGSDRTKPNNGGTGGIFRRQVARRIVADDFEWFHKTIIAEGPHMAVWVNGYQVSDWTDRRKPDPNPRRGRRLEQGTLILQGHDPTTDLSFRNIRAGEMTKRRR